MFSAAPNARIAVRIAKGQGGGAAAAEPDVAIGTHVPVNPPIMNNLSLFVACETNADIVAGLIQKALSEGFTINVPFTYCQH